MTDRAELEVIAMALPAVEKVIQWGDHDVFKVGGKVFAVSGGDGFSFKVTDVGFLVITEGGVGKQAPYMAKGQWVFVPFDAASGEDATAWLKTSHELISAKLTKKARLELGLV